MSLWDEASADYETMRREAAVARADAEMREVMPFLLAARSDAEFGHRIALAADSIGRIAAITGVAPDELAGMAAHRFSLMREALMEGQDPLAELAEISQGGSGYGSGPEKPDEHSTGQAPPAYSEVPAGAERGPNPAVTAPRPPMAGPVAEPTASMRRSAANLMTPGYRPPVPPDTGTGAGSVDIGLPEENLAGMAPSLNAGGRNSGSNAPITNPQIGQVTSTRDPVRRRVLAVSAAIRETNPHLPQAECERVARTVVGRYLRHADLTGSVMDDQPVGAPGNGSGGGNGGSGGKGMSGLEEYGLGRQMIKKLPGFGSAAGDMADAAAFAL